MRESAKQKLITALEGRKMTDFQRTKIYDQNFDTLISNPLLDSYRQELTKIAELLKLTEDGN